MTSLHDLYLQSKDTVTSLITEHNQFTNIPACPEWTLRDLLGHQAGEIEDGLAGNMEGMGTPAWTAAQVERHRHQDLEAVKAAWTTALASAGDAIYQVTEGAINDLVHHEFDVRGALGDVDNRDGELVRTMTPVFAGFLDETLKANALPALRLVVDSTVMILGDGTPAGELRMTGFEFLRMVTGRRSMAQIQRLDWNGDHSPWLAHMSLMPPREGDLVE